MLTHPNTSIIPAALAGAEVAGASGKDYLTGVAAGYEVMERLAADFIPQVMSRGFHPGPVFSIFGAGVAGAKIMGLNEDQMNSAIALCASLASSNIEGPRGGGKALREGAAVKNAMLAVALAQNGHVAGDTVLEGDAGFYHAYTGNNKGLLSYSFVGDTRTSLDKITADLGQGLDVPGDALSHLLHRGLQHRAHRRAGRHVQGAQHQARERRARRCGGELDGDAVSEPRFPEPAGGRRGQAGNHGLLHRLRHRDRRLSGARAASLSTSPRIRRRCWT